MVPFTGRRGACLAAALPLALPLLASASERVCPQQQDPPSGGLMGRCKVSADALQVLMGAQGAASGLTAWGARTGGGGGAVPRPPLRFLFFPCGVARDSLAAWRTRQGSGLVPATLQLGHSSTSLDRTEPQPKAVCQALPRLAEACERAIEARFRFLSSPLVTRHARSAAPPQAAALHVPMGGDARGGWGAARSLRRGRCAFFCSVCGCASLSASHGRPGEA